MPFRELALKLSPIKFGMVAEIVTASCFCSTRSKQHCRAESCHDQQSEPELSFTTTFEEFATRNNCVQR